MAALFDSTQALQRLARLGSHACILLLPGRHACKPRPAAGRAHGAPPAQRTGTGGLWRSRGAHAPRRWACWRRSRGRPGSSAPGRRAPRVHERTGIVATRVAGAGRQACCAGAANIASMGNMVCCGGADIALRLEGMGECVQGWGRLIPCQKPSCLHRQVGYVITGLKDTRAARVGDTWHLYKRPVARLPGFKPSKSMVFAGAPQPLHRTASGRLPAARGYDTPCLSAEHVSPSVFTTMVHIMEASCMLSLSRTSCKGFLPCSSKGFYTAKWACAAARRHLPDQRRRL